MVMVRRSLPFRVLCLLLIACVLCCSCLMPYAQAVVVESAVLYGAYELIAAMLIGGGVVYATSDDARSAAAQVYDWLATNASAALDKINFWVAQAIVGGVSTGIRVSKDIWDMIASAFESLFSDAPALDVFEYGRSYTFDSAEDFLIFGDLMSLENAQKHPVRSVYLVSPSAGSPLTFSLYEEKSGPNTKLMYLVENEDVYSSLDDVAYIYNSPYAYGFFVDSLSYGDTYTSVGVWFQRISDSAVETIWPGGLSFGLGSYVFSPDSVIPSNDLVFPSDNSLVRVPDLPDVQTDEDGKEVVVYPDLSLNPTDHLADIPKQETGEQVDVPYDTLVDIGTGEAVGEGVENPDIPTEGTDTGLIQNILDKITNFFDSPSDFKLDFDGFKNLILPDRFPFCIPFDLINSVRVFAASAANFSFDIDLETSYFSVHHTVDLSPFAVPIAFFRYTCVLFWIWVLITRTRDLMKW